MAKVPGIVRCCCGTTCAICWVGMGIWAFFFLGILALLFNKGKQGNIGHFTKGAKENAKNIFITWIIYVVVTVLCGINFFYRSRHPFPPEEDDDETNKKQQFSAIGTPSKPMEDNLIDDN